MRGLLQWANAIVLIVSSLIALVAIAIILNLGQVSEPQMIASLCVAMISLPVISLTSLRLATMQGLHRVVLGQIDIEPCTYPDGYGKPHPAGDGP